MLQDMSEEEEEELRRQQQQQQQQLAARGYPYEPAEPHAEGKLPPPHLGAPIFICQSPDCVHTCMNSIDSGYWNSMLRGLRSSILTFPTATSAAACRPAATTAAPLLGAAAAPA
jgi:hypothetical protein